MSLERKKSDCSGNPSGSNDCLLQKRSTKHRDSVQVKRNDQLVPRMFSGDEIEALRLELENETKNR
jgi:hypothetical protein